MESNGSSTAPQLISFTHGLLGARRLAARYEVRKCQGESRHARGMTTFECRSWSFRRLQRRAVWRARDPSIDNDVDGAGMLDVGADIDRQELGPKLIEFAGVFTRPLGESLDAASAFKSGLNGALDGHGQAIGNTLWSTW